jgi:hypothetical protein
MDNRIKVVLGLARRHKFDISKRKQIIQEFLSSGCTKREIWAKYSEGMEDHGQMLRWMRELGYKSESTSRSPNFVKNINVMPKKEQSKILAEDSFEILQLKKRVKELEIQLKDSEMKAIAYSTMIDIAEKEFKIPIRKKANTKPLK